MTCQWHGVNSDTESSFNNTLPFLFVQPTWPGWRRKCHRYTHITSHPCDTHLKTTVFCCRVSATGSHLLLKRADVQRAFIQSSWGVKPEFLPSLLPDFDNPLTPDDIAALSEDPFLHSRIISTSPGTKDQENEPLYTLKLGPFAEDIWETLPASNWTLLVQGVDSRVPRLRDLLDQFSFVPNWRVDDIQASYATPGGGVGPHVDNYDVFLIQAAGVRKWYVGHTPIPPEKEDLEPDLDVRVLKGGFKPDAEYILHPGDALYVPPRFPHWGISQDDECITLSVGFRAPTISNLLSGWVEHVVDTRRLAGTFYIDDVNDLSDGVKDPGRVSKQAANKAFNYMKQLFADNEHTKQEFFNWFAQEVSQRKTFLVDDTDFVDEVVEDELEDLMTQIFSSSNSSDGLSICQQVGAVFTYVDHKIHGQCVMYIDGTSWAVSNVEIAKLLCSKRRVSVLQYRSYARSYDSFAPLVRKLLSAGLLRIEDESDEDTSS